MLCMRNLRAFLLFGAGVNNTPRTKSKTKATQPNYHIFLKAMEKSLSFFLFANRRDDPVTDWERLKADGKTSCRLLDN